MQHNGASGQPPAASLINGAISTTSGRETIAII